MMISAPVTTDSTALAASIAHWWALAGVDVAVSDMPHGWLDRAPAAKGTAKAPGDAHMSGATAAVPTDDARKITPPPAPVVLPPAPMPDDMDGFMAWLANDPDQPEAAFSAQRILPHILPDPDILVITDLPTQEDMGQLRLFSGVDAGLLSAMLRSIGVSMDRAAMASLLLARPAGGIVEDALLPKAAARLTHFIRLLKPRAVILLGDRTSRAFEATNGDPPSLSTRSINLDDGMVSAMALPAPFVLLKHPERKAAAWAQLRQMAKR